MPSMLDWRQITSGQVLRLIDNRLREIEGGEPVYRLATAILDAGKAPAGQLAVLYHQRWETSNRLA